MGTTPISTLAYRVEDRIEETEGSPVFWSKQFEVYSALAEACNDLMLLVGRPTQTVQQAFTLVPNTCWQTIPQGVFVITDIFGAFGRLRKVDLHGMDYTQSSWSGAWENDTDPVNGPRRWFPLGLNMFGIHPAATDAIQLTITGIAYPFTSTWPYQGTETAPFSDEFFVALEEYASAYLRLKEGGKEFEESMSLYGSYLKLAQRMSAIQDRRDPQLFASPSMGAVSGLNQIPKR